MKEELQQKIRQYFSAMSIYKDPKATNSIFAGRNLPSFVKDYLLKRYLNINTGEIDTFGLNAFLDKVIPANGGTVKDDILAGKEVTLLARFSIYIDLIKGVKQFAIPDYGIKQKEGIIPDYVYAKHPGELVDGEKWTSKNSRPPIFLSCSLMRRLPIRAYSRHSFTSSLPKFPSGYNSLRSPLTVCFMAMTSRWFKSLPRRKYFWMASEKVRLRISLRHSEK